MFESVVSHLRKGLVVTCATALCSVSVLCGTAAAQTTVVLNDPGEVTDTTIRNGAYVNANYARSVLLTRASSDPDWERRTLLKFDTENTIPDNATITSARLTLTVKTGLGYAGEIRSVQTYRVPEGFLQEDATWNRRMDSSNWSRPGGSLAEQYGDADVSNVPGTRVTFDVTALVQRVVNGDFGARWTRIGLVDESGPAKQSYREYYQSEDSYASRRPSLTVVYASATTAPSTPSTGTGTSLRVLQWNIAQGRGTDGQSNIDRVVNWVVQMRPDLISFNEILKYSNNNQPQIICDKLRAKTGQPWAYHFAQIGGAASGIGVAVLSRLPIEDRDSRLLSYTRSVAMVSVTVNGRRVNFFSTHLDHQDSGRRLRQVIELKAWAGTFQEQRIVAGDFNWYPGTTEINEMVKSYWDGWAVAKSQGTAISYSGNPEGNTRNTRIDYVFKSRGASALNITGAQVYNARAQYVSDHQPLIVSFKVN
jgi:endonuclease/exonuclease/phosphatase family metal-dependent hydrolase